MKQFGTPPPLSKRTPFLTYPPPPMPSLPISEQFFQDPLFVQISKARTPLILGGRKLVPRDKNDQISTTSLYIHSYILWFSYAFRVC